MAESEGSAEVEAGEDAPRRGTGGLIAWSVVLGLLALALVPRSLDADTLGTGAIFVVAAVGSVVLAVQAIRVRRER